MANVLSPPVRYLPTDITGASLGILPNAEIIKTYVADPIECRDVRVLVSVKDRIFKDSNGKNVGYWYDNENISGILKLRVQFTTGARSGGFFGALIQRAASDKHKLAFLILLMLHLIIFYFDILLKMSLTTHIQ